MKTPPNYYHWMLAIRAANHVDFLRTHEEKHMYASALYLAMQWCSDIEEEKKQRKNK